MTDSEVYHSHFIDEETKAQEDYIDLSKGRRDSSPGEVSASPGGTDFPRYTPQAPPGTGGL